jgi:hypothetical protein
MSTAKLWSPLVASLKSPLRVVGSAGFLFATPSGSGLFHAVAVAVGDHDVAVVQEPVEHADGGGVFGQESAPGLEGPVRADAQCPTFVGGGDESEQQLRAGVIQWREAEFVDEYEVAALARQCALPADTSGVRSRSRKAVQCRSISCRSIS